MINKAVIILAACVSLFSYGASAQVANSTQGLYNGKAKVGLYHDGPVQKESTSLLLDIGPADCVLNVPDGSGGTITYVGNAQQLGPNVYVNIPVDGGFIMKGRMTIKGSAGKQSLSGTLFLANNVYAGHVDYAVKLKQIPIN